jgi:DNA polymerase III gamma/tau subunit
MLEDETLMQITDALLNHDAGKALSLLDGQMLLGREPRVFADSLIQHWRMLIQAALHAQDKAGMYDPAQWSAMIEQARRAGVPRLLRWWEQMAGALSEMRSSGSPRAILELYLLMFASETPAGQAVAAAAPPAPSRSVGVPADETTPSSHSVGVPPTTTPPTEQQSESVDSAYANQLWQQKVAELVQRSPAGGMHLQGSRVVIEDGAIRLILARRLAYEFFKQSARREQNLVQAARSALGMPNAPVKLEYTDEPPPEEPPPPPVAESRVLEGEELIDAISQTFNGYEVEPEA